MAHFRCFSTIQEIIEKCYYQQELARATPAPLSPGSAATHGEKEAKCLKSSIIIEDTWAGASDPSLPTLNTW